MVIAFLTAAVIGTFCTTIGLWVLGVGSPGAAFHQDTSRRLDRLREGDMRSLGTAQSSTSEATAIALRRRVRTINFGGLTLISGGMVERWARDLERAGLTLNVREYFMLRLALAATLAAVGALLLPQFAIPIMLVGAVAGFFAPGIWVARLRTKRVQTLESQLPELLTMIASALRAGFGLSQALESAAEQLPEPMNTEIRSMLRDTAVGSSIEAALEHMNERVNSPDFDIVVSAINIQRSVGGNLAEILDTVSHTMRERDRIRGEIRTLTSQQRMSGYVIGGVPIGLFGLFMMINPEYTGRLITEPLGRMMLVGGGVLWMMGFLVIRKIVNIEV
jgi:tight adherence protein B